MNINLWLSENKTPTALATLFVVGAAGLGYLSYAAWDEYGAATADYTAKAAELDRLSHGAIFPSASNLRKLFQTLSQDQANLDKLTETLRSFRIPSFGDFEKVKPQDQPQYFQDILRAQVTNIRSLAANLESTLPPTFYLGLDEYENRLPQPDQLPLLTRQLTVLNWLAKTLVSQKGMIIADFTRIPDPANTPSSLPKKNAGHPDTPTPFESLGSTRVTLRCGQGALREILNTISAAPYFLIIEDIKVQNSVTEPPRRESPAAVADQPADGSATIQRLPIIVGRESLTVFLKIRTIDFPTPLNQSEASK